MTTDQVLEAYTLIQQLRGKQKNMVEFQKYKDFVPMSTSTYLSMSVPKDVIIKELETEILALKARVVALGVTD